MKEISDDAVKSKTGKTWKEWFTIIDKAGAKRLNHKQIAEYMNKNHLKMGWWGQMITAQYEQARGLREKHQKTDGYEIGASKTFNIPLASLFKFFQDDSLRNKWLKEKITIHKSTPNKSMRVTWTDGKKSIGINFYEKGKLKSQVAIQHGKLLDSKQSEKMKSFWTKKLETLNGLI